MIAAFGRVARRLTWPMLLLAGLLLLAAVAVVPTRTYLAKRDEVTAAQVRLEQLTATNDAAQGHVDALGTPAEIERIAREQYGMVKNGEEPYRVTPEQKAPVEIPDVWPFNRLHPHIG